MEFSIKDYYRTAVEAATNGKNTVMYDDYGNPNIMVGLWKYDLKHLEIEGLEGTHPAFIIGDKEVDEIWIGKTFARMGNGGCGASIPTKESANPFMNVDWDTAYNACAKKGKGWHIMTNLEYSALWKMCGGLNYSPHRSHLRYDGRNSDRTSDNNGDGVMMNGGSGELLDGIRLTTSLGVKWFADSDGNLNNDFINRPWRASGIYLYEDNGATSDIPEGNGKIIYYTPNGKATPKLATGRAALKNCVCDTTMKEQDANKLTIHGLVNCAERDYDGFCHVADHAMTLEEGEGGILRNVSWNMSPSRAPLTYLIGLGFQYTGTFRPVYVSL